MTKYSELWTKEDEELRNYFAAKAMQAIIRNMKDIPNIYEVSAFAFHMADEMMEARTDTETNEEIMKKIMGGNNDTVS